MKIVGFMVCGPNEKYLEKPLSEFKRLCDDAIIVTNNATQKEKDLIKKYGHWTYEDNREWGKDQPRIKQTLLEKVGRLNPDWIIALDADECFAPAFDKQEAIRLASADEIAFHFLVVNLYNDENHFAHSSGVQRFWNIRFYKWLPQYGTTFQNKALHCGLAPPIFYKYGWYAPYYLEHWGLMEKEARQKRVERYQTYDPKSKYKDKIYYQELAQDLPTFEFDRQALLQKLKELPECKPRIRPKLP
jgi:hypothetical protein